MATLLKIPGPTPLPLLGNALSMDQSYPLGSLEKFADEYGPIYKLNLMGRQPCFISSHELFADACDETRFEKSLVGPLIQLRHAVGDGLFTAMPGEENWAIAHRTLIPAFGPLPIQSMFPEMHDIASQLVLKWARFGPENDIDVTADFTRLTLDTIALCAMGTRFNSFYHDDLHPFVGSMVGILAAANARAMRPEAVSDYVFSAERRKYADDSAYLQKVAKELVAKRRENPSDKKDLLNAMLKNRDPKLGVELTDESVVNNMVTFLAAGHETTSGLLSFLFYELCSHPEVYAKAQEEVDNVIGTGAVNVGHMSKLPYLTACLRETLRLHSTAPLFALCPKEDDILAGKYPVQKGQTIGCILSKIQTDPKVYGEDAQFFKPERMLDEQFEKLPKHAWKPFGNGVRGCIGRAFAWQEALLTTALLLQIFDFRKSDASYKLKVQQTLTIKPDGFEMRAKMRNPEVLEKIGAVSVDGSTSTPQASLNKRKLTAPSESVVRGSGTTINIYYGSNTGTCESLATSLASTAKSRGFNAHVDTLDSSIVTLRSQSRNPIIIITASYEGQPPDNAAKFVEWLTSTEEDSLSKVQYAVFGVGNREWVSTYQKVPTTVDEILHSKGAHRLVQRGIADVCDGEIFNAFDQWTDGMLWPILDSTLGQGKKSTTGELSGLKVQVQTDTRTKQLRQDMQAAVVLESKLLTAAGKPAKRHLSLRLPEGWQYKAGDYLAVLPLNPEQSVRRAMARFDLTLDATLMIEEGSQTTIPTGRPISAIDVFASYVELGQPATTKQVLQLSNLVDGTEAKKVLVNMAKTASPQTKLNSLLELLEQYPSSSYTLGQFLEALPSMRTRQYSISSSPLKDRTSASLTYSVVDAPVDSSRPAGRRFLGVASNYLARAQEGDRVHVALRPSHAGFHLPVDLSRPILMACAGTGLAPFRAFVEERAIRIARGEKLGRAMLFFGCNGPDEDDMYSDEFSAWEQIGAVEVRRAFTFAEAESEGCKFVQHRVWRDREEVVELFQAEAFMYICGAGAVGSALVETMKRIYMEFKRVGEEEARVWFEGLRGERYWADVFS